MSMFLRLSILILLIAFEVKADVRKILFIGDSLTEGYGVSKEESYPYLIQKMLEEKYGKGKFEIVNGSISGSTSASALSRLKWFKKTNAEIVVLALGANDGLRGIKPIETKKNLEGAIDFAKELKMKVLLLGMMMPPNYGKEYTEEFKQIYTDVSISKKISYVPFLLDGVAGEVSLNQDDGIHPNDKGHKQMAKTVFPALEKML